MKSGVTVTLRLHEWIDGKGNEEEFTKLLDDFIAQTVSEHVSHIVIHAEPVNGWSYCDFIKCIVSQILGGIFLSYINKSPSVVALTLNEQADFGRTLSFVKKKIEKFSKG